MREEERVEGRSTCGSEEGGVVWERRGGGGEE